MLEADNFDAYGPVARRSLTAQEAKVAEEFFVIPRSGAAGALE